MWIIILEILQQTQCKLATKNQLTNVASLFFKANLRTAEIVTVTRS